MAKKYSASDLQRILAAGETSLGREKALNSVAVDRIGQYLKALKKIRDIGNDWEVAERDEFVLYTAGIYGVSPRAAMLALALAEVSITEDDHDVRRLSNLTDLMGCHISILWQAEPALLELERAGLLWLFGQEKEQMSLFKGADRLKLCMPAPAVASVIKGEPFAIGNALRAEGPEQLMALLREAGQYAYQYDLDTHTLWLFWRRILDHNTDLPIAKTAIEVYEASGQNHNDGVLLVAFVLHIVHEAKESVTFSRLIENHFDYGSHRAYAERLINLFELLRQNIIEPSGSELADEGDWKEAPHTLTREAIMRLGFDVAELQARQSAGRRARTTHLLPPDKIRATQLVYAGGIEAAVDELAATLEEERYQAVRNRLRERDLRLGVTAMFYGPAGTGKTETAMQLARRTGRAIQVVDIAQMRDKWVGESEKNVAAIFNQYKAALKGASRAPILLLNEADALLNTRMQAGSSADVMNNTMQNIFLEELERMEGILIATTNLVESLDPAFERRFLFKLRFDLPDAEAASKIWRSRLPELTEDQSLQLAKAYNLSGGQIENVVRKYHIHEVLHGNILTHTQLLTLAGEEHWTKGSGTGIGFKK